MKNLYLITLRYLLLLAVVTLSLEEAEAQRTDANVFGDVKIKGKNEHIPFATIYVEGTKLGTSTDHTGHYMLIDLPPGTHVIVAKSVGYKEAKDTVTVAKGQTVEVNFSLAEETMAINEVVITGTKTFKRQTESPVIVNILDAKSLNMVQATNISEGLRFQPGLRVETDCQTCNYTQLRMNGLGGSYSQILINGRPVFSPLTGLYGMEQIPANMVERIEVVRGGGSALYGSSAIGGTVNIITRIPAEAGYDFSVTGQRVNGESNDLVISGNINMLTHKRNAGAAIFINKRDRQAYDHNGDQFSELPELKNNSFGANLFFKPAFNQKLEVNFSSLYEYRYGGEEVEKAAYQAQQSEERTHHVFMGGLDYQIDFNGNRSSFITYFAGQYTDRDHYTGIYPDAPADIQAHLENPPYGFTENTTIQVGTQLNHRLTKFLGGSNNLTVGAEYVFDDVLDTIPAYQYVTNQETRTTAGFAQSDWDILPTLNLLTGVRVDKHNLVDKAIVSPRVSLLYKYRTATQLRFTWGTGFRAPQAFDSDMHIAFAGGGVSRISLAPDLKEERSNSFSASVNYDKATEFFIAGFTLEGFYTKLNDAFYLEPIGSDDLGERFEKRNGSGATVQGGTIELRANYNRKVQLESGFTLQSSKFEKPVENIEGLEARRAFMRTPDKYGYLTLMITPNERINASISSVYTGPMQLAHFAGAPEQPADAYITTPSFTELNFKMGYTFLLEQIDSGIEIFGGVKNLTNDYQDDFDSGKNRDSNYIYGPAAPRTIYLGLRLMSL
ncbi:MAG: TonB-dependent receptor [Prolixibacteraceae bacterium]